MPLNEHVIAEQSSQSDAGEQSAIRRALESTARPENLWRGVCAIVVCHAFIWSVAPLLTVGDLHSDTLEIVSWASQLAMGNPKHPPMATWIMHMVLALPGSRLFNLFALSQLGVAIASLFVWRSVRLYAEPPFAALAVLFFLESPAATFFALNVNHNAMLIPVAAAVVFFTLRYLENRSRKDAALLGLSTGIALLTKYEIALLVLPLLVMCVFVPRFRGAWTDARSFLAVAICAATIAPHLYWDWTHNWMTLGYATAERPISTASDLLDSANQLLDALAMVAVGPALTMLFLLRPIIARGGFKPSYFGICLSAGPVLAMIALSLATRQVIRQGWLVPMIPMIMTGAAIALGGGNLRMPRAPRALGLIGRSCVLSLALMAGYSIELVAWTLAGSPIEAYSFDSKALAAQISNSWKSQSNAPLRCFATSFGNRVLGATLYFHPLPRIVDLTPSGPAMPPCGDTGGVIVILSEAAPASGLDRYGLYSRETDVPAMAEFDNVKWSVKIYVAPPTPRTQG